jgi:hypothetical protein
VGERTVCFSLVVAGLALVTLIPQTGQTASGQSPDNEHARHNLAIRTLRAINTAEYSYRSTHGTFASGAALAVSEEFKGGWRFAAQGGPQLANLQLSEKPEILPGWVLRLNVASDGKGYDALLEDTTDKACGYAAITNESGLIRQSKTIDCDI